MLLPHRRKSWRPTCPISLLACSRMATCGRSFTDAFPRVGRRAFNIRKTNGHAIAHKTFLIENPHLREEAKHNNIADRQADYARSLFYDDRHIQLSEVLVKRVANYTKFVQAIHDIIYRVYIASQALRKAQLTVTPASNPNVDKWITHAVPEFHHDELPRPLDVKVPPATMNSYLEGTSDTIRGLAKFLLTTKFSFAVTHPGITWYELYLLALAHTSQPTDIISSNTAASAKLLLYKFAHLPKTHQLLFAFYSHLSTNCTSVPPRSCLTGCRRMDLITNHSKFVWHHCCTLTLSLHSTPLC